MKLHANAALSLKGRRELCRRVIEGERTLGRERLRRAAVAGVPRAARRLLMRLVAEMLGQLRRHRPLNQPAGEIRQQPSGPDDLLLRPRPSEQLVDQLVTEALTNLRREIHQREVLQRARSATGSLRSPSELAALPAGATGIHGLIQLSSASR